MEKVTGLVILLCLISLSSGNRSPEIESKQYKVCEDTPVGDDAFTIKASDPENDPLEYLILGVNAVYFSVNKDNGTVKVKTELDREAGDVLPLDVQVSDGFTSTSARIIVLLLDANDNKPRFEKASYDVEIPEDATVGTTLFRVQATDFDTSQAGAVQYTIQNVIPRDGFNLFGIVKTTGVVTLQGHLNYTSLSTFYQLTINASDGGGNCYYSETKYQSSVVNSFITVLDISDMDPQFIGVPYEGSVEENSDVGQTVLRVTAIDKDTGVNNDIIYSIEGSTADGLFTISNDGGVISVFSHIDREVTGDTVTLTVKAKESKENNMGMEASTTTKVQINIIDVNDNKPEFYRCGEDKLSCVKATEFTGEVFEHSLGSININMTVRDLDNNARTELILEGPDKNVFSVEPKVTVSDSTIQLLVKQPQELDYEKTHMMTLHVIAIDQGETSFSSTATVTIYIKDTNDNSPTFPKETYKLTVNENSPDGTIIDTITAEDPDTMDQNITYTLLPESIRLRFDVEPLTGTIYVKNGTLLDREVRSLYPVTLQARDTEGKTGITMLEITLTDVNDKKPVFNRDSYLVVVKEGQEVEVKIQATDEDDPDELNSHIVYGIPHTDKYSDNFTIDPDTGVLRNKGELDLEALDPELDGRIELNVTATDKGTPPLSSTVTVIINLQDVNDNTPQFSASFYNFAVRESDKGAYVGSVHAEDLDQTLDFNRITFSFAKGSSGSFLIRSFAEGNGYSGNITLDPEVELDYESGRTQYKLQVVAADLEQKKSEVTVTVDVLDVNDERPEFNPTDPVTVNENTTISEAIGRFTGKDKDGNYSLVYKLESIKCRCNGSWTPCDKFIVDVTGEVRVNPDITLDYEECDQAQIEAQVVDEFTEKGHNSSITSGIMVINIKDINDNGPEFIPTDSVFVVVAEGASKGTAVAKVNATDRDSGIHSQIEFKISSVQFVDTNNVAVPMRMLFEVVTTQQKDNYVGIVQTSEKLELSLKGKYLVTVTATDTGGLSSHTVLEIFTVDESYKVELQFERPVEEIEQQRDKITWALTAATKAAVEIVSIRSGTDKASRNADATIMVAYFVYSNGTAINSNEVEKMLADPEHYAALTNLGLMYIGKGKVNDEEGVNMVQYILLGMVGGLLIVLVVLTTSLLCTRRNYKRKLKAAKAMKPTSMADSGNQKSGPVVPGTNKYTMEGANPVLNLNIDSALVLDLDEQSSDVDKVSLNSLDYSDDMNISERDTNPIMVIQEEEEEEDRPPEYTEALGAALAHRGQKKEKHRVGFNNPAFSTTDL
ncbi:cadherin-related family member 2 isoform X2 [Channa argus]|uniref:cadherin-related family member 2 isoform X2 n=1 Tax=Channa argus TaxID=215402 RepID=UPI0035230C54